MIWVETCSLSLSELSKEVFVNLARPARPQANPAALLGPRNPAPVHASLHPHPLPFHLPRLTEQHCSQSSGMSRRPHPPHPPRLSALESYQHNASQNLPSTLATSWRTTFPLASQAAPLFSGPRLELHAFLQGIVLRPSSQRERCCQQSQNWRYPPWHCPSRGPHLQAGKGRTLPKQP